MNIYPDWKGWDAFNNRYFYEEGVESSLAVLWIRVCATEETQSELYKTNLLM